MKRALLAAVAIALPAWASPIDAAPAPAIKNIVLAAAKANLATAGAQ